MLNLIIHGFESISLLKIPIAPVRCDQCYVGKFVEGALDFLAWLLYDLGTEIFDSFVLWGRSNLNSRVYKNCPPLSHKHLNTNNQEGGDLL